jgi:hypothetical protein
MYTVQYSTVPVRALVKVIPEEGRRAKISLDSNKLYGVGGERMQKG